MKCSPSCLGRHSRSLCMASQTADSDGPYRHLAFRLKPIRHDFSNVLVHGDLKKLRATAEELLRTPGEKKSPSFWDIYSKRSILLSSTMTPVDMAVILRSFHEHRRRRTGVYAVLAACVVRRSQETNGRTAVELLEVLSRRLNKKSHPQVFQALAANLPNVMYELSARDVVQVLYSFYRAGGADAKVCRKVERKLLHKIDSVDATLLAAISSVHALHQYQSIPLYNRIESRAGDLKPSSFYGSSAYRLLHGFWSAGMYCHRLLRTFRENLLQSLPLLSGLEVVTLREMMDNSSDSAAVEEVRREELRRRLPQPNS